MMPLFTRVRGETVWKIAEGFLAVRFWRQEADDLVLFASVGGFRSPELGLIPIFQTVSEGEFSEVRLLGVLRSSLAAWLRNVHSSAVETVVR
jgi:hypothetical protein